VSHAAPNPITAIEAHNESLVGTLYWKGLLGGRTPFCQSRPGLLETCWGRATRGAPSLLPAACVAPRAAVL
jgi:hypothetical protein